MGNNKYNAAIHYKHVINEMSEINSNKMLRV